MAVLGNIPSLVINTFVALNIVLDKQWRIQLSFMCKHHHTVLSRSTAHFLKKFKLEIHTKRSEDSSGGEKNKKTKPPRYLQRSFCFLTVTFSSSVAVEFTGRKWDMTMRNCSKPISSREPTSFWCWFLYHNQNKPMYRLVLTNAISAFSCLFWLKKRITINNDNPKLFILIQWMKISPYCGKINFFFSLFSLSQELFACEQKPHAFTDSLFIMQFIVVCSAAFHPPKHDTVIKNANNCLVIATKPSFSKLLLHVNRWIMCVHKVYGCSFSWRLNPTITVTSTY